MCMEKWLEISKEIAQHRLHLSQCGGLKANALHKVICQGENTEMVPILVRNDHLHNILIRMLVFPV